MKICSLLPSGTEILYALGLADHLAGVTDLCAFPPEAAKKPIVSRSLVQVDGRSSAQVEAAMLELLSSAQNPFQLDVEWFQREEPDLVLTQDLCYICDVDAGQVRSTVSFMRRQPEILVLSPTTMAQVLDCILRVGNAALVADAARALVRGLQARIDSVAQRSNLASQKPRVLSFEGIDPLVAGGNWLPDMKAFAGGIDGLFQPGCSAARIAWQTVLDYDPDIIVISLCSSGIQRSLQGAEWLTRQEGWRDLSAVASGQVYALEHSYFSIPGPRLVPGIEMLAQVFHPDIFHGLIPPAAAAKLQRGYSKTDKRSPLAASFQPYPADSGG